MFDSIRSTIRARRQPKRPQSELPRMRDDTESVAGDDRMGTAIEVIDRMRRAASLKDILLPPVKRSKPMTFSNLIESARKQGQGAAASMQRAIEGNYNY